MFSEHFAFSLPARINIVGGGEPALLSRTSFKTARTVEEALEMAFNKGGRNQKIYLMPQGSSALPKLRKA